MTRNAIESYLRTSKMGDQSKMARNAIQSDFQTSKIAAGNKFLFCESEFWKSTLADGSHFVKNFQKKLKLRIDLKWPEMRSNVNLGHPKWPTSAILSKIIKKSCISM